MDKERLRIPSDSSSGSSSHGGASPNLSSYHNNATYLLTSSSVGPPPNSPASFSPLLAPPNSYNLPPPPGLTHPSLGAMYSFPPCPTTVGYQNMNYPMGMSTLSRNQPHVPPPQYNPSVVGVSGQYDMNGYPVQNSMMHPQAGSPPPGYNNFYGSHHHPPPPRTVTVGHPNQHQSCGPITSVSPRHGGIYDQSGDSLDLEKRLNLLLSSANSQREFESGGGVSGVGYNDFMTSSKLSFQEDMLKNNASSGMSSVGHVSKDEKQPIGNGSSSGSIGGVMNPIIENLVGSMSMCNGTYTHFGPSNNHVNKVLPVESNENMFGELNVISGRQNGSVDMPSKIAVAPISKEQKDMIKENAIKVLNNSVRKQLGQVPDPLQLHNNMCHEKVGTSNNISLHGAEQFTGGESRASSPRESGESSRPQTPGKPSYLEVLTKAGGKNQSNVSSGGRKVSSTSSSPVQSAFSSNSDSVPNLSHRKSVDYFVGATASSPASSCPSTSSSPATKPRNFVSRMLLKGKENVSSSPVASFYSKQSGNSKNSPSNSPTHNVLNQNLAQAKGKSQQTGGERKVLSSQNSTSSGSNSKTGGKSVKNGKVPIEKTVDLGESAGVADESEWGWKTYTSRGRNNNLTSVGNKNSVKRASNGSCGSDTPTSNILSLETDEEEGADLKKNNGIGDDVTTERKSSTLGFGTSSNNASTLSHSRKQREKEKPRNRKEDRNWRNCITRRVETLVYIWLTHMISALTWLWSLVTDVASLSASLGVSLMLDFYTWTKTKAVPSFTGKITRWRTDVRLSIYEWWSRLKSKISSMFSRGGPSSKKAEESDGGGGGTRGNPREDENILSLLGPDRNITLPANGDEALKRLLSVKGQDPYSILGVRSDSSDETIRRYYKRQAVLVHPDKNLIVGAEEAFKILARAFEMVGDPVKRAEYHHKLMEAQAKEKFCGEIGNLLEQLRKKMEAASSTIRCTKCNSRHKKSITDRPLFAARYCSQCRIHHGAREGELWAERGGWFGITWNYFACMDAHIWEINEWARCQKTNLKHIKADAHCVMYRLVAGGNNHQNHHNQHCHGTGFEEGAGSDQADEWDSLINNLYKSPPGSSFGKTSTSAGSAPGKAGCCAGGSGGSNPNATNGQAAGKRRKGKRNK